jgi:hypothetical protein
MGGLSLVIVPGEDLTNVDFSSDNYLPMILTVPAVSPRAQDFEIRVESIEARNGRD